MSACEWDLTDSDQSLLVRVERKQRHIRAAVDGLVHRYHTGLFLSGGGGVGKSHTVIDELHAQRAKYVLLNSRLTAKGLVDVLAANPDDTILIEDAETIFRDPKTPGLLRSALFSLSPAKPMERSITWKVGGSQIQFIFTGSIIVISNTDLSDELPEIRAMKTRITILRLDVTNEELLALMKKICGDGYQLGDEFMSPAQCWEIAKFIRDRLSDLQRPLDLRLLKNGFRDYLQSQANHSSGLHWRDLLEAQILESISVVANRRADRLAAETKLAAQLNQLQGSLEEKIDRFMARFEFPSREAAQRAFYRRLERLS